MGKTERAVWVGVCKDCGGVEAAMVDDPIYFNSEDCVTLVVWLREGRAVELRPGPVAVSGCKCVEKGADDFAKEVVRHGNN